tara:strand:+ start:12210 stop:13004 length:795 start_codon:yes stop_codon:yes gene_type:complete
MAKKSLGQNFLIDHNIAKKINRLIKDYRNYNLIEVGPGKGFLTDHLINNEFQNFILIEKDYELYLKLVDKFKSHNNIKIFNEDAVSEKIISNIDKPKIIVSNLPYNISIKLITKWLEEINEYLGLFLMIQKEVADRFKYQENSKINRLNLLAYLMSNYKKEFDVSPNVFIPKPKVTSSVVSFKPNIKEKLNLDKFKSFTRILFSTKRKKIINNLIRNQIYKEIINKEDILKETNIDLNKRPEDLNFKETIMLYNILNKQTSSFS